MPIHRSGGDNFFKQSQPQANLRRHGVGIAFCGKHMQSFASSQGGPGVSDESIQWNEHEAYKTRTTHPVENCPRDER